MQGSSFAQTTAREPGSLAGTIRDTAGAAIPSASISIEEDKSRTEITTNQDGSFGFSKIHADTVKLHVDKAGYCSLVIDPLRVDSTKSLDLVLTKSDDGSSHCPEQARGSKLDLELADKPSFTIAGVTDWSGAGGHGSDTTLPTTEKLTQRALAMKSQPRTQSCTATKENELRAAVAAHPSSFEANHQLGMFCLTCGRYADALSSLEAASRIKPEDSENALQLAYAYQQSGNVDKARTQVSTLLVRSDNADAHRMLGDIEEQQGEPLAAVREYEHAVQLNPSAQNYFSWGTELLLHRAVQPATEVFTRATRAHPDSPGLLAGLGAALYAGGAYEEAARQVCTASDLNPGDDTAYLFLGTMQKSIHQPLPCALDKLKHFAEHKPDNAFANFYYAVALWKRARQRPDAADSQHITSLLAKAISLDPTLADAYLQLGNLYSAQRNFAKAVPAYEKAIEADPQLSEAHYELGLAYKRLDREADARREFEVYAHVQKANTEAAEQRRREIRQFVVALANPAPAASQR